MRPLWLSLAIGSLSAFSGAMSVRAAEPAPTPIKHLKAKKSISAPSWITNLTGYWRVVRRTDGRLAAIYSGTVGGKSGVVARFSSDNGRTWSETQFLFPLPDGISGPEPLVDRKGELQLFFLKERKKTSDDDGSGMPMGIDIWHTHTRDGWTRMDPPVRIWRGYCGSMNCEVQLKSGRILFPFSYYTNSTWSSHRGEGFDAFTYHGRGVCTLLYSDDDGDTWKLSPARLRVTTPDLSTDEGAIEPVLAQLSDGRVWMLLRTQYGRFYESISPDGAAWSPPQPTRILSSDSPAGLVRLDDGRILLLWNDSERFPYAYGGRHVLHGAISSDDGKTWRGFREVDRDPRRGEPPPPNGDHGTAYPIPGVALDGMVITTTGLSSPRYNLLLDPNWLLETRQQDDFSHGLEDWSAFGVKGVELIAHPDKPGAKVLQIRKSDADWPAGAVWNFPAGTSGTLRLRLQVRPGFAGALIGLTDHFSVPFDDLDRFNNLFNCEIGENGILPGQAALTPGRWHDLTFRWNGRDRTCRVLMDNRPIATLPQSRDSLGVNYLRIRSTALETDPAGLLIESVQAQVSP